jgi:hypothetical protein
VEWWPKKAFAAARKPQIMKFTSFPNG